MKFVRSSLAMAWKDLRVLFKDRGQLAVIFLLPLLFSLLYGAMNMSQGDSSGPSGEPRLVIKSYIVNEDQGPHGAQVEEALRGIRALRLLSSRTVGRADEMVAEGEAPAAIIIPADFSAKINASEPVRVQLIKDPTQQVEAQTVAQILDEVLTELGMRAEIEYGIRAVFAKTGVLEDADPEAVRAAQAQMMGAIWTGVQEIRQNPAIAVRREDLAGEVKQLPVVARATSYFAPAFATLFAFFLIGFMAQSLLKEREAGSMRRLVAAPIHRGTVVAGKMLAFVVVVFLQMGLVFGLCHALFGMPLGDSVLGLLALTLALALAATGMGMALGSIARTAKQADAIGVLLGFVLFFVSGSITPTGYLRDLAFRSEGLRFYLSQLTPNAPALDGYLKLFIDSAGLVDILPNILALLGFAVVFFLVGLWRFRYE